MNLLFIELFVLKALSLTSYAFYLHKIFDKVLVPPTGGVARQSNEIFCSPSYAPCMWVTPEMCQNSCKGKKRQLVRNNVFSSDKNASVLSTVKNYVTYNTFPGNL